MNEQEIELLTISCSLSPDWFYVLVKSIAKTVSSALSLQMQLLYNMIVKSQKQEGNDITKGGKIPKHKYEYDSDEDTEGGTWEHKLRKKEMAETVGRKLKEAVASPKQF